MNAEANLSDLVRAFAKQDWDTADRIANELGEAGWKNGYQIIGAAFAIAVHRRFGPGTSRDEIAEFVADIRSRYEGSEKMPALELEGLIRAALGEHELVDNISGELALQAEMFILGQLLQDSSMSDAQLDHFIAEVEETAAEYS